MKNILVCTCGGIAVYKVPNIVSALVKEGYNVTVAMSENSTKFISPIIFESLTKNKVYVDLYADTMSHINLALNNDLVLVVPATYNIIGKIRSGIADDLISTIISATKTAVFFAMSMNDNMYNNVILLDNINYLKKVGFNFIEAEEGFLACNKEGIGRLKSEVEIIDIVVSYLQQPKDNLENLVGKNVIITAGSTKEYMDPIRFLGNNASGKMGYYLAVQAYEAKANVSLIMGNSSQLPRIFGVNTVNVISADDMYKEVNKLYDSSDIVIATAAVTDYKFKTISNSKIKRNDMTTNTYTVELEENIDILATLGKNKGQRILVGFALETDNIEEHARQKLKKKNLDFIIANNESNLGSNGGIFHIISDNEMIDIQGTKSIVASEILYKVNNLIKK